ncbi:MAG: hypothetical protein AAFX99_17145 [Myxococcota bacterium]
MSMRWDRYRSKGPAVSTWWWCIVLAVMTGVGQGCTDVQPFGDRNTFLSDEAVIDSNGGDLFVGGARLSVPRGALEEPMTLSLTRVSPEQLPALDESGLGPVRPVSHPYRIGPQTIADLEAPASLAITLFDDDNDDGNNRLLFTVDGCDRWMLADHVISTFNRQPDNTWVFSLRTFATFMAVEANLEEFELFAAATPGLCLANEDCPPECSETTTQACLDMSDAELCGVHARCIPADPRCGCAVDEEDTCALLLTCALPSSLSQACRDGLSALRNQENIQATTSAEE